MKQWSVNVRTKFSAKPLNYSSGHGAKALQPSDSVGTEIRTSFLSFPTLVHQEALLAVVPYNFLDTFIESIFNTILKIVDLRRQETEVAY